MMKRFFATFVLTTSEQRVVVLIMVGLVVGALVKHHQESSLTNVSAPISETPLPLISPTPNDQ